MTGDNRFLGIIILCMILCCCTFAQNNQQLGEDSDDPVFLYGSYQHLTLPEHWNINYYGLSAEVKASKIIGLSGSVLYGEGVHMEKIEQFNRRKFIKSFSGLFIGTQLITGDGYSFDNDDKRNLWDEFTDEENELIKSSAMATDILNYPKRGFSCAGSIFSASLTFLGKSDDISHVASSFGGGIGRSDLCGLLTGAHMAIGVSSGMIYKDVKERQKYAREISNKYWEWWESLAPIHCSELRPKYDKEGYSRMIQRVALKVEELIKPALSQ